MCVSMLKWVMSGVHLSKWVISMTNFCKMREKVDEREGRHIFLEHEWPCS